MNTFFELYEIQDAYRSFIAAWENGDIPDEAVDDTLEGLDGLVEEKADSLACLLKSLDSEAKAIKDQEQALAERRRSKEIKRDKIKGYISDLMQNTGKVKIETPRNRLSFRKSTAVQFSDEAQFLRDHEGDATFLTYKDPAINRKAVSDALKAGSAIQGAELVNRQNLQIK